MTFILMEKLNIAVFSISNEHTQYDQSDINMISMI